MEGLVLKGLVKDLVESCKKTSKIFFKGKKGGRDCKRRAHALSRFSFSTTQER